MWFEPLDLLAMLVLLLLLVLVAAGPARTARRVRSGRHRIRGRGAPRTTGSADAALDLMRMDGG